MAVLLFLTGRKGLVTVFECNSNKLYCNIINIMLNNIYIYANTIRCEREFNDGLIGEGKNARFCIW